MVIVLVSWQAAAGKEDKAWAWANEVNDYANKTYGEKGHVMREVTPGPGQGGRITFFVMHESIAAWGELRKKRNADPKWQEFRKGVLTLLVPSTFSSTIYEERKS